MFAWNEIITVLPIAKNTKVLPTFLCSNCKLFPYYCTFSLNNTSLGNKHHNLFNEFRKAHFTHAHKIRSKYKPSRCSCNDPACKYFQKGTFPCYPIWHGNICGRRHFSAATTNFPDKLSRHRFFFLSPTPGKLPTPVVRHVCESVNSQGERPRGFSYSGNRPLLPLKLSQGDRGRKFCSFYARNAYTDTCFLGTSNAWNCIFDDK